MSVDNKLFPNGRWLVCAPEHFEVLYEINPWMHVDQQPLQAKAQLQWINLHHTLLRLGCWIEYIDPIKGLPDMVYTANAGLVRGKQVVLSTFKHPERQREAQHFKAWYERHGFNVHVLSSGTFEGEGDALFAGEKLFCGFGLRSDDSVYSEVASVLGAKEYVIGELVDPWFYHLDTCFCPLNDSDALIFPAAFTPESIKRFETHINLHPVPEADARRFACNSVVLSKQVVMPAECAETIKILNKLGIEPFPVALDEFLRGGGSAKCLTNRIA